LSGTNLSSLTKTYDFRIRNSWNDLPSVPTTNHDKDLLKILVDHGFADIPTPVPLVARYTKGRRWTDLEFQSCFDAWRAGTSLTFVAAALNRNPQDMIYKLLARCEEERMRATTEGIVRDLVGRILLEEFVAIALNNAGVEYLREDEYDSLAGVVYDFRADLVIPHERTPKAFIEVRKSSARHASLYAKDKLFSAINWKGRHENCLGVLIVDAPWTATTLIVLSRVFDYVVPVSRAAEVASKVRAFVDGDDQVMRWWIQFRIIGANDRGEATIASNSQ
jgi:hypothetical protein